MALPRRLESLFINIKWVHRGRLGLGLGLSDSAKTLPTLEVRALQSVSKPPTPESSKILRTKLSVHFLVMKPIK